MSFRVRAASVVASVAVVGCLGTTQASAAFTAPGASESQKTFLTAETTTKHVLTTPEGTVSCTTVSSSGSVTGPEQSSLTLSPTYSGCEAFGFKTTHVTANGCTYRFEAPTSEPTLGQATGTPSQVRCPAGKTITITPTSFGASVCTMQIAEQSPSKGHVVYINNVKAGVEMDYAANATVEGLHYTSTGGACGSNETHSDATYSGQTTIKGYEDEAHSKRYGVTVAVPGPSLAYPFTAPGAGAGQKTFSTGEGTTTHVFKSGGEVSCKTSTFSGSVTGSEQLARTLAPAYSGCSAFGFTAAHVALNGCTYRLIAPISEPGAGEYTGAPLQILCPAGKKITITPTSFGASVCTQSIAEQSSLAGHVVYTNNAQAGTEMDFLANITVEGIAYTGTGGACGTSGNATYSGQTTVKGYEDEAHAKRFGVTVA
jgi:hypothetical protein